MKKASIFCVILILFLQTNLPASQFTTTPLKERFMQIGQRFAAATQASVSRLQAGVGDVAISAKNQAQLVSEMFRKLGEVVSRYRAGTLTASQAMQAGKIIIATYKAQAAAIGVALTAASVATALLAKSLAADRDPTRGVPLPQPVLVGEEYLQALEAPLPPPQPYKEFTREALPIPERTRRKRVKTIDPALLEAERAVSTYTPGLRQPVVQVTITSDKNKNDLLLKQAAQSDSPSLMLKITNIANVNSFTESGLKEAFQFAKEKPEVLAYLSEMVHPVYDEKLLAAVNTGNIPGAKALMNLGALFFSPQALSGAEMIAQEKGLTALIVPLQGLQVFGRIKL